jgi:glucose/arabinose dehydrogenase
VRKLAFAVVALCTLASDAFAQPSPREQAVAIDKVELAPTETADLERLARGLRRPWCIAFTADGDWLITEKYVGVRVMRDGVMLPGMLAGGPPNVLAKSDSGLLDIALDPDFAANRTVYIAFAEGDEKANRTAVWKARYDGKRLTGGRVIFRAKPDKAGDGHPGGRILFLPDKTFLLTIGDGYEYKEAAQDLASHLGKTLRLTREGAAPADNPFAGRQGALPEIWTLGHRNAQGLARDPTTGEIWLHEHGPRGGDEINVLRAGANYGWPTVTHGIDYDGTLISERAHAPGMERSHFYWAPSIAPSGLVLYRGKAFPDWQGQLFVGGLASRNILRLSRGKDTGLLVEAERMLSGYNKRIRDLREGPDGFIYVLTDEADGELLRLVPKASPK